MAWYLSVQIPRSPLIVTRSAFLAPFGRCSLPKGGCGVGAVVASSRENLVVGEVAFFPYGSSSSCDSRDEIARVDAHGLLVRTILSPWQASNLRGENVLAVWRFTVGPSSVGDWGTPQSARDLDISLSILSWRLRWPSPLTSTPPPAGPRRALDVAAKQVYSRVWARPGGPDGLPN